VGQNPYQPPTDTKLADTANGDTFRWKSLLYRTMQIASWFFASIVASGLAEMVREYRGPGQGAASPFGKLTGQAVLFNIFVWAVPTAIWLWLIHTQRIRNYFISEKLH